MLIVNTITVPDHELQWSFVRSSGPGGQNVNKVASKAVLRWHVVASPSLPAEVKQRLCAQQRLTTQGELVVSSQRYRDQARNIEDCLDKVRAMIEQAQFVPKKRKRTRPGRGAKEARLRQKRHRAGTKYSRRKPSDE